MMTAQYQAALHSYAEGRYEEAVRQFSELLYEDPRNPKLHIWLGATFRKAGKIEHAKVQYQQVLALTDDPDLLDLASTSLAQIQNKLAHTIQNPIAERTDLDSANTINSTILQKEIPQIVSSIRGIDVKQSDGSDDETQLASNSNETKPKASVSNGLVPPPPAIAALLESQQQEINQNQLQSDAFICDENTTQASTSSTLQETIANIQSVSQKANQPNTNKRTKKQKNEQKNEPSPFRASPVEVKAFVEKPDPDEPHQAQVIIKSSQGSSAIALEDILKFSTVGQKITLWGALVATIPAIILGIATYKVGDSLLLSKARQAQQSETIAIANATGSFLQKQSSDVGVLKTLFVSTELESSFLQSTKQNAGQVFITTNPSETNRAGKLLAALPVSQQRQYKQLLTSRLNLYSQAYPQYTSIALFSTNGELLAKSNNSEPLPSINPNTLNKASSVDNVLIDNPKVSKEGSHFYAIASVKSSISQKATMVLQVEIPVKLLTSSLNNNLTSAGSSNFYVIDSANKYIASSQPVTIGDDASAEFAGLSNLRSLASSDIVENAKGDRNVQIIAYAPVANMQSYGTTWDVLTTVDKTSAISGIQNLLLVIGGGIGATPLLVAAIAYVLSRGMSRRLKDIRAALRDLRQGDIKNSFAALSTEGNDELSDISLSINKMSEQFQTMMQKQEQEKQKLQLQVVKLFNVLSKLAREEKKEFQDSDLSDQNILSLGKKIRGEMVQRNADAESYRKQKEDMQSQLMQMLRDVYSLTDGDLTVSTKSIDGSLTDVSIFFDDVMKGLQNIVGQVKASASQVNLSLGQNEQAIANLTNVSQRQVDTVMRSLNTSQMAKLSANTIATNSQQVIQSSHLVASKLSDSDRSIDAVMSKVNELQSTVKNTAKRVKHLGETSQKIAKAISSINEIAIKTNFLAINASLEASRTGNMGMGFVMVAEEVGELATRSVAATKEVESLLINIQSETNAVMTSVESGSQQVSESNTLAIAAKDSLLEISYISQQIDELVSSISDATISQVQTSEGVANLMKDISHIAQRNLDTSEEVSKSLKTTKKHSGDLQQSLVHFKTR